MKPVISYLIATKNRGNIIAETLRSLQGQSVQDWEAVIVDGQSSDNTAEVVAGFGDDRLRFFQLEEGHGSGASCARNFAALIARAEIVAILDSDDLAYPQRSEITMARFKADPELDIFYGDIDVWEEETGVVRRREMQIAPFSLERLSKTSFIPHSTVAIKREVLINNPYNQFFHMAEDYELWTRLATAGKKFDCTEEKLVRYRLGGSNISVGGKRRELTKKYDILVKMIRGWVPFDYSQFTEIESLERELKQENRN